MKEKTQTNTTTLLKQTERVNKKKHNGNYKRNNTYIKLQMFALIFVVCFLILLLTVTEAMPIKRRKSYSLRKGGRLERHHRRSLNDWVNAAKHLDGENENVVKKHPRHSHRHKKKIPKIKKMDLDQILKQMDSIVRPRFGK